MKPAILSRIRQEIGSNIGKPKLSLSLDEREVILVALKTIEALTSREMVEKVNKLLDELIFNYNYTLRLKNNMENHSWSRRQTRYDSEAIATLCSDLMNISNGIFEAREHLKALLK